VGEYLGTTSSFEDYRPGEDLVNSSAKAYYIRGTARAAAGRLDEGIVDLETAKQRDPSFGYAYWTLGIFYRMKGHLDLSLESFERAAELFTEQDESMMAASAQREAKKLR